MAMIVNGSCKRVSLHLHPLNVRVCQRLLDLHHRDIIRLLAALLECLLASKRLGQLHRSFQVSTQDTYRVRDVNMSMPQCLSVAVL